MDECGHSLRNLKVDGHEKMTMVPFHWLRLGKDHLDSGTDKTFLGSFSLFSILTQAPYWPGKESVRVMGLPQWLWPYRWRLFKMLGETVIDWEKKAYASQVWHNDCDPIADICVKCWGKTGIDRIRKAYTSRVCHNDCDPISDVCVECEWNRLNDMGVI